MPTESGLKRAWTRLHDADHRLHYNVQATFTGWMDSLDGVPDDALDGAVAEYVLSYRVLQRSHGPTQLATRQAARTRRGQRWPTVADVARLLAATVCKAPPTPDDLLELRWWAPTGSSQDAEGWMKWSTTEAISRAHLDQPCRSAWHPHQRIPVLSVRHWMRWDPDWPNPFTLEVAERCVTSCGAYCALGLSADDTDPSSEAALYYRGLQSSADPYLGGLDLAQWCHDREVKAIGRGAVNLARMSGVT